MILVITNKDDITSDFVINELNKRKVEYFRLNTEDIGNSIDILFDFKINKYLLIDNEKKYIVDIHDVTSVYYRRPKLPDLKNILLYPGEKEFLRNEIYYTLEGLYKILRHAFWISHVYSIREAENKIFQQIVAKEIGFDVPDSLITNVPEKAKLFIKMHEDCVIKPIKNGLINNEEEPKIIFTSQISAKHIGNIDGIQSVPTYFQKEIKKDSDIRVTVVGKEIFAAEILSQVCEETKTDWRQGEHFELEYKKIKLPCDVEKKCIELMDTLKLNFGAIDFVLNKEGKFIFLEINPNGQWGWIQKRLGFKICEAIVDLLISEG